MSSGAFAVVVNEWVSVDSFFLIGEQRFENIIQLNAIEEIFQGQLFSLI